MEVKGKKVLVFGLGISGIGAGQILERHGAEVIMYDGNQKLTEKKEKTTWRWTAKCQDRDRRFFRKKFWKSLI